MWSGGRAAEQASHTACSPTVGADGYPTIACRSPSAARAPAASPWASGRGSPGWRAAPASRPQLQAKLIGLESRQYTGWLDVSGDRRSTRPHTETRVQGAREQDDLLLANGFMARRGLAKARKEGRVQALGTGGSAGSPPGWGVGRPVSCVQADGCVPAKS